MICGKNITKGSNFPETLNINTGFVPRDHNPQVSRAE